MTALRGMRRTIVLVVVLGTVLLLALWGFLAGRKEAATERERERPVKPPRHVSIQNGEVILTLDAETRTRSGLLVAAVAGSTERQDVRAYATVVDLKTLATARSDYATSLAQAEKARAAVEASRREYERLRVLHADAQNVSTKAMEAAHAAFQSDQASAEAAGAQARTVAAIARQDWGSVLGGWVIGGSPALMRLLNREEALIQITVPPETPLAALPDRADVLVGTARLPVRLISAAARTDPKIQGRSGFYVAPARAGLLPGMNLAAAIRVGGQMTGGVIPASAVVFTEGRGWAYVQTSANTFTRREVPTDVRASGDGYLAPNIAAGTAVVVRGAQQLLSEEFRAQIAVGEEGT